MSFRDRDLDDEEYAAVLAGLALLQASIEEEPGALPLAKVQAIYTDDGRFTGLSCEAVGRLAERINLSKD